MTTMNAVVEAVREAAVAVARAVDHLGVKNGKENEHGEDSGNNENNLGHLERPMTLATFLKVNPPKFKGTLVATDADNWFRGIERSLRAQHVPEGQHMEFATYMLEGEVKHWWQGIQRLLQQNENDIPWDTFRDEFYKKYFLGVARDAKEMELMQLKQGDMAIAEYARKFDDLCHFSKICQGNPADFEEWKCLKFEGGLRDDLMSSIVPLEICNFAELVNKSKSVEECIKKVIVANVSHQGFPPRRLSKHQVAGRMVHFKARGIRQHKNLQVGNITTRHTELGHIAKDCPKGFTQNPVKTQQQGRVFAITIDDVVQSDALIQGEGGISKAVRNLATLGNTIIEVGADHYGFYHEIVKNLNRT
ncbi:uncharacterized protein LOC107633194 [Arachis ipaensis]|uniref:uncharacterized protein LOC107633194 n=1 Tax=Arachis ipaensis TaxID=130454 RepID=UPI0007AF9094|nr:uncharacterized protein LOC107633194 [Arachis ipaensis]